MTLLGSATEPVRMLVWGVALLVLASGARALLLRLGPAGRRGDEPVVAEPLVAELMADRG